MIQRISLNPCQVKKYSQVGMKLSDDTLLPLLGIDEDSYIVAVELQSGINFNVEEGTHCVEIGKGCSLADGITFMINLNHDYNSVRQGELSFLAGVEIQNRTPRKGSIIIQNDVWIGHGATIMAGVTLHNGCVVAADSVVTKDVPPYTIVGGNPAKVIRYRFDKQIVDGLQKIAWWDWSKETKRERRMDFALPPEEFVEKYLPEAEKHLQEITIEKDRDNGEEGRKTVLFFPDLARPAPLYPKVIKQFCQENRPEVELLIYLSEGESTQENISRLETVLQKYEECDCSIILQTGVDLDEAILFQLADYYVTTRGEETVRRTCLSDRYGVKILYGTDEPMFPSDF